MYRTTALCRCSRNAWHGKSTNRATYCNIITRARCVLVINLSMPFRLTHERSNWVCWRFVVPSLHTIFIKQMVPNVLSITSANVLIMTSAWMAFCSASVDVFFAHPISCVLICSMISVACRRSWMGECVRVSSRHRMLSIRCACLFHVCFVFTFRPAFAIKRKFIEHSIRHK